ncbi:PAS domain-containing sensor histidine kinase [Coraliomargarita sinensis]|nr:PAS domain-containing sensor histidine kinase [Coraliomargarita sinensis]
MMRHTPDKLGQYSSTAVISWAFNWTEQRFITISEKVADILDYPAERWHEAGFWRSIIHPEDREAVMKFCTEQTEQRVEHELYYRIYCADGSIAWIQHIVALSATDEAGQLISRGVFIDASPQMEREANLRTAKEEAEAADRAKTDFLGMVSHDLRTPLNPILGFTSLLEQGDLSEEQREYVQAIQSGAERQLNLIDKLLEFTRLERGSISADHRSFAPILICQQLLREIDQLNTGNQLKLLPYTKDGYGPVDAGHIIKTDLGMLQQILSNLLTNAAKYTERGKIQLYLGSKYDHEKCWFYFAVEDTGLGIPDDKKESLFDAFSRVDSSYSSAHEGMGLGLSIVKRLVDLLGGEIGFSSHFGRGSRFYFSIPSQEVVTSGSLEKSLIQTAFHQSQQKVN